MYCVRKVARVKTSFNFQILDPPLHAEEAVIKPVIKHNQIPQAITQPKVNSRLKY